jgi:hypothetical protein
MTDALFGVPGIDDTECSSRPENRQYGYSQSEAARRLNEYHVTRMEPFPYEARGKNGRTPVQFAVGDPAI